MCRMVRATRLTRPHSTARARAHDGTASCVNAFLRARKTRMGCSAARKRRMHRDDERACGGPHVLVANVCGAPCCTSSLPRLGCGQILLREIEDGRVARGVVRSAEVSSVRACGRVIAAGTRLTGGSRSRPARCCRSGSSAGCVQVHRSATLREVVAFGVRDFRDA